ncbi:hypothetical protein [Paraburkholderia dilworthii]|uniref:hypothetical protein n=1 Tax=Paraburkholderia dilworthii TaxID=948106 RepID=UPI00042144F6|nr:hypothetical protein [Paraburkholderia dilworthii]
MRKGKSRGAVSASARIAYALELARGSSHISSTLTPETEQRAIGETLAGFCETYGEAELAVFQELLAEELRRRARHETALAVISFRLFSPSCAR